jgi:hypothetical protein
MVKVPDPPPAGRCVTRSLSRWGGGEEEFAAPIVLLVSDIKPLGDIVRRAPIEEVYRKDV